MSDTEITQTRTEIDAVGEALKKGKRKRLRKLLKPMHPAKIASALESLSPTERASVWEQVDESVEEKVLAHLDEGQRLLLTGDPDPDEQADAAEPDGETRLDRLLLALERGKLKRVGRLFRKMHPARIAGLLESLPPNERLAAWEMVESDRAGKVLRHLHREVRRSLALQMDSEDLVDAARRLEPDERVDLIQDLPEATGREILQGLDQREREQLETMLSYPEDTAGGLMNLDQISIREDLKVGTVLRYLRLLEELPAKTNILMVVNRKQRYQGVLRVRRLLTSQPGDDVANVVERDFPAISADLSSHEVARHFEDQDLISAPVVDSDNRLLGRITVDDVVDVIREESEHSLMGMAGLDEGTDMFAPVLKSSRVRAVWLGINLLTAFLAAWVIGLFEETLAQIVALAVLMPIVASMGGIAGSQTLTLVIRGLALGHLERGNTRILLAKELGIGLLNGFVWALVVALLAVVWFGNWAIGGVIAVAVLINLICAAVAAVVIPLVMRRLGIDPALAGSVVLTTVTDVVGFFAFLGLATLLLL
jgi:magnesium transporter